MRLISFLTDVEKALLAESPAVDGGAWETTRMVNFHHGLARLSLTPRPAADSRFAACSLRTTALSRSRECVRPESK